MFQQITILGYIGKKPELRYTGNGVAVTTLNVATTNKYKDKEETTWFNVSVWGNQAENCVTYLDKGSMVLVVGRLVPGKDGNPRTYQKKDGGVGASFDVNGDVVRFAGGKNSNDYSQPVVVGKTGDDIPF